MTTTLHPPSAHSRPTRGPRDAVRWRWDDVHLLGTGVVVPEEERTTAQLEERLAPLYRRLGFRPGWVEAVTGIASRRLWPEGTSYLDGAVAAAEEALQEAGLAAQDLQAIVSCSVYRHRLEPSLASELQGRLGIGHHAVNFDLSNACLGFLSGMATVANMIALGQIEVGLVVSAEDASPVLESTLQRLASPTADIHAFKDNLATLTLGSAATAVVLASGTAVRRGHQLLGGTVHAAAEHHGLCRGDAGGMVTDSVQLLREGVSLASRTWLDFRSVLGWGPGEVGAAAMHQVGKAHHEAIVRALGVPDARAPRTFPWLGNVGSCGVPATAFLAARQGLVAEGDALALLGIGSGLNCAMLGVRW
ncbi:MAG: 3-oxoacyl-ACP synthase III [Alphaproteobacteria bacterium]|nr:3-oxoacyl-ACP synthase III [Alphaproteobacteria bacterium]